MNHVTMAQKFSGPIQVLGLLGCFLAPALFLVSVFPHASEGEILIGYIPFLLMPTLALRILFEGDDSNLGKFFFRIGDGLFHWLFHNGVTAFLGKMKFWAWFWDKIERRGSDRQDQIKKIEDDISKHPDIFA
jgi:hypothetical protein